MNADSVSKEQRTAILGYLVFFLKHLVVSLPSGTRGKSHVIENHIYFTGSDFKIVLPAVPAFNLFRKGLLSLFGFRTVRVCIRRGSRNIVIWHACASNRSPEHNSDQISLILPFPL